LLEGAPCWAALVGRGGHRGVGCAVCVRFVLGSRCVLRFAFFAGFKQDAPSVFRGPSWLSPTGLMAGGHDRDGGRTAGGRGGDGRRGRDGGSGGSTTCFSQTTSMAGGCGGDGGSMADGRGGDADAANRWCAFPGPHPWRWAQGGGRGGQSSLESPPWPTDVDHEGERGGRGSAWIRMDGIEEEKKRRGKEKMGEKK
jgi:hypothetical protein